MSAFLTFSTVLHTMLRSFFIMSMVNLQGSKKNSTIKSDHLDDSHWFFSTMDCDAVVQSFSHFNVTHFGH